MRVVVNAWTRHACYIVIGIRGGNVPAARKHKSWSTQRRGVGRVWRPVAEKRGIVAKVDGPALAAATTIERQAIDGGARIDALEALHSDMSIRVR